MDNEKKPDIAGETPKLEVEVAEPTKAEPTVTEVAEPKAIEKKPSSSKKKVFIGIGIVLVAVAAVAAIILLTNKASDQEDIAAIVNGVPITMADFETQLALLEESNEQYSEDEKTERVAELEDLTIDQMVDEELTRQMAEEAGIEVTDEEIDEQYDMITQAVGDEDQLNSMLEEQGMTSDQLRDQIRTQLLTDHFITQKIGEPEVTDAEIEADYKENKEYYVDEEENVMSLEDARDQIADMLLSEKQNEAFDELLEAYRTKSTIAVFVGSEAAGSQTDSSADGSTNE